ncbi:hypothetical protein SLE2022_309030 [Rubroshorea leprosula]
MTDRIYPSSKPAGANGTTAAASNPTFPATKSQIYGASTRPLYRPQSTSPRPRRSRCCSFCLWLTLIILLLLVLAAIAGATLYVIYRPHRPSFSLSSLKISTLNLTSTSTSITELNTNMNLDMTAKNPNKKLVYTYDPFSVTVTTADDIDIGDGSFPSFVHPIKNTTLLKAAITVTNQALDDSSASKLKTYLKSKNGIALKIKLDTKLKGKMGGLKIPKVGVRVSCEGITATVPAGKTASTASISNMKCEVDLRIKIWKWTF